MAGNGVDDEEVKNDGDDEVEDENGVENWGVDVCLLDRKVEYGTEGDDEGTNELSDDGGDARDKDGDEEEAKDENRGGECGCEDKDEEGIELL